MTIGDFVIDVIYEVGWSTIFFLIHGRIESLQNLVKVPRVPSKLSEILIEEYRLQQETFLEQVASIWYSTG